MTHAERELILNIKAACKINRPPSERLDLIKEIAAQLLKTAEAN